MKKDNTAVKTFRPYKMSRLKKVIAGLCAMGLALGIGIGCTACNTTPTPTPGPGPIDPNPPIVQVVVVEDINELLSDYSGEVTKFIKNDVLEDSIKYSVGEYVDANLVNASFDLGEGSKTSLESVQLTFTYKGEDNTRSYYVNETTFDKAIELNKIAEYDKNKTELAQAADNATVSTTYSLSYDGYENKENSSLSKALYNKVVGMTTNANLILEDKGTVPYPVEGGSRMFLCHNYNLVASTGENVTTYTIYVKDSADIEASLNDSTNYKLAKTKVVAEYENNKEYKNVQDSFTAPTIQVSNVGELVKNYSTELNSFLASNVENIVRTAAGSYNASNITALTWDVGADNKTSLPNVSISFTVKNDASHETVYRADVEFATNLSLDAIAKEDSKALAEASSAISISKTFEIKTNTEDQFYRQGFIKAVADRIGINLTDTRVMLSDATVNGSNLVYKMAFERETGLVGYSVTVENASSEQGIIANVASARISQTDAIAYSDNLVVVKEYEAPTYTATDVKTLLATNGDVITENLTPVYENVLKKQYGNNYETRKDLVQSYSWDIEDAVDGKVQNLKLTFLEGTSDGGRSIYVYKVNLGAGLAVNDLLDANKVANTTTTQTREYFFNYNENDQHTAENSALAGAVAEALVKDGFDYSSSLGTVKLVTDEGVTNDSDWSTARRFKVVFMNSTGIREFYIRTPNKTSISEIVQDIESGKIKTVEEKTVDFAGNTLEVYLANEAENA